MALFRPFYDFEKLFHSKLKLFTFLVFFKILMRKIQLFCLFLVMQVILMHYFFFVLIFTSEYQKEENYIFKRQLRTM